MVEATHSNNGSIDEPQSDEETHYHSDVEGQRYAYRLIHGVPGPPFMRQSVCASLRKTWSPRNDDIFVVTYPKSGTTWMQQLLLLLLRDGSTEEYDLTVKSADSPWLEGTLSQTFEPRTREWLDALPSRRILKTHSPLRIFPSIPGEDGAMPYAGGAKTIFVVRNPKDTAVSFFHHARNKAAFQFADGEWPAFFDIFMRGGVGSGDWFEFVTEWWDLAQRRPASVLWVHYEEMLKSPGAQILRIAQFLGVAPVDEERLSRVVAGSRFDAMKATHNNQAGRRGHFRRGVAGGWREEMSEEQSAAIDEAFARRLPLELQRLFQFEVALVTTPPH